MAKVIKSDTEPQSINSSYSLWRVTLVGVVLGTIFWILSSFLGNYIQPTETAGNIATILVATLGIMIMLRYHMAQSVVIAVATGVTLWGLAQLTRGLTWFEAVVWSVFLYGLAYALYSWMARYIKPVPILAAMLIIAVAARVVANL